MLYRFVGRPHRHSGPKVGIDRHQTLPNIHIEQPTEPPTHRTRIRVVSPTRDSAYLPRTPAGSFTQVSR